MQFAVATTRRTKTKATDQRKKHPLAGSETLRRADSEAWLLAVTQHISYGADSEAWLLAVSQKRFWLTAKTKPGVLPRSKLQA